ncbi:MAG: 30S ribosome-binding factor RbfA [Lentisphaerae bacterium]|nr:30S ribosome-binding factor RbfA [Lentisphaerota bacterium]
MSVNRLVRINELLKREIGSMLYRLMTGTSVNLAAVTVTRVDISRDLKHARVLVSINDNKRDEIMAELRRHRIEIQRQINHDIVLKRTPVLKFELDTSIEEGDKMLKLLNDMSDPDNPDDFSPLE